MDVADAQPERQRLFVETCRLCETPLNVGDVGEAGDGVGHAVLIASGLGEPCVSLIAFTSIDQARDNTRIDNWPAKSRPRVRSASVSDASFAVAGTTLMRVTR